MGFESWVPVCVGTAQSGSVGFQLDLSGFGSIVQLHFPCVCHWLCPKHRSGVSDGILPGWGKLEVCIGQNLPDPSAFFPFHLTAFPVEKQSVGRGGLKKGNFLSDGDKIEFSA